MKAYAMSFDCALLERAFWLYVWHITDGSGAACTSGGGDSSSPHASSPFKRIGQHLDAGPSAKGNALARQLKTDALIAVGRAWNPLCQCGLRRRPLEMSVARGLHWP
jgi:hypothetical protein